MYRLGTSLNVMVSAKEIIQEVLIGVGGYVMIHSRQE